MTEKENSGSAKMWGGRFSQSTSASVEAYTASIHYDARLYKYDIMGSRAHAQMLANNGLLSAEELKDILDGLSGIENDIDQGDFEFRRELEDIHMNIEKELINRIGDAGAKLHSGRSRNDQVALDIRLYLRDESDKLIKLLTDVRCAFVALADNYLGRIMPGYTHLQRAQPVLISHHMLAYFEMFGRDVERLVDCRKRINILPLGSAALAGTGLPIDREQVAEALGFDGVTANSMDTTADRDFAIEFVSCCTMIQLHLSRLSEELVLWASQEFSFVDIDDRFCTGSSIMPQKKNPDIPELMRGKSGRVVGSLMALITMMKGLPLTYNRDMQEDKEQIFDAIDTVVPSLAITAELLSHLNFHVEKMEKATRTGYITATDLADYLVLKEVPFREAHSIVGKVVAHCIEQQCELTDLNVSELRQFSDRIDKDVFEVLSVEGSVNSRISTGGTGLQRVAEAVDNAKQQMGMKE